MAEEKAAGPQHNPVLEALKMELTQVDPEATPYVHSVIDHEIRKLSQESVMKGPPPNQEYIELNEKSRVKLMHKIYVPVDRFPGFNFVGKILGNKGENLKKIALETKTRIAILGQGSAKKNMNVQELIDSGDPEHLHLKEPLHVRIESYGPFSTLATLSIKNSVVVVVIVVVVISSSLLFSSFVSTSSLLFCLKYVFPRINFSRKKNPSG